MVDKKVSALTEAVLTDDDVLYVVDDPAGVPTSKKVSVAALKAHVAPENATYVQEAVADTGLWYGLRPRNISTFSPSQGILYAAPTLLPGGDFVRIAAEVTSAGEAGSVLRLGIYSSGGDLILDAGTAAADTVAVKEITIEHSPPSGFYLLAGVSQLCPSTAPTVRSNNTPTASESVPWMGQGDFNADTRSGYFESGVTGALPSSLTMGSSRLTSQTMRVEVRA